MPVRRSKSKNGFLSDLLGTTGGRPIYVTRPTEKPVYSTGAARARAKAARPRKTPDELNREFLERQGSGTKRLKSATFKGRKIEELSDGSWVVPSIDRESQFDSLQDAKAFIGDWKQNPAGDSRRFLEVANKYFQQVINKYGESNVQIRWIRAGQQAYSQVGSGAARLVTQRPVTPHGLYTFLHESAHILMPRHFEESYPNNRAEIEAALWALDAMNAEGVQVPERLRKLIQRTIADDIRKDAKKKREIDPRAAAFVQNPITDRAHRYRANNLMPSGPKVCALCGSKKNIVPDHIDGHPDHTTPGNLQWLCKSCNTAKGFWMRDHGKGRLTHQYNPTEGVPTYQQYAWAVAQHSRGAHDEGGAIIHATPAKLRSEYAAQIADTKRSRGRMADDERWNPAKFDRCVEDVQARGGDVNAYAVCTAAGTRGNPTTGDLNSLPAKGLRLYRDVEGKTLGRAAADAVLVPEHSHGFKWKLVTSDGGQNYFETSDQALHYVQHHFWGYEVEKRNPPTPDGRFKDLQKQGFMKRRKPSVVDFYEAWTPHGVTYKGENKHFAEEQVRLYGGKVKKVRERRQNPESSSAALYESFHGVPSTSTLEVEELEADHGHLALLGRLVDCWVITLTGFLAHFEFDEDPPVWCSSAESGRQLYFVGGDQAIDLAAFKMDGEEWRKDRMVIGQFAPPMCGKCGVEFEKRGKTFTCSKCGHKATYEDHGPKDVVYNLGYHTSKKFSDEMEEFDYQHDLGEETGVRPMLEYDPRSKHLYVTGGQYRIEQPLFETSPGIEN